MNEPKKITPEYCCMELKEYVRENPTRVVLAGIGLGLLLALLIRPRKAIRAEHRAVQLLEDIQHRVKEIAEPAYHRAVAAAEKNAAAFKERAAERIHDLDIPSSLCAVSRRLKQLFH